MSVTSNVDLMEYAKQLYLPLHEIVTKDQLPSQLHNGCYIINMQNETAGDGTHWVSLYIENGNGVFFDPFGLSPPTSIQKRFEHKLIYSSQQIQSIRRGYCGMYCIMFCHFMCSHKKRHPSLQHRLNLFQKIFDKDDLVGNEKRLKYYLGLK